MYCTPVIFRVLQDGGVDYNVFALFPTIAHDEQYILSYDQVGQHCAANYGACIRHSRRATPEEYASLWQELVNIGYDDLKVFSRKNHTWRAA
jgi:hypothetical protein